MITYLDYNASSPPDNRVLEEMIHIYKNYIGNSDSRTHIYGQNAKQIVDTNRQKIASLLSVEKDEIFFTSGATESDNIAILGLASWGESQGKKHIISTKIEHKAVLEPLKHLEKKGFNVDFVDVDQSGRVKTNDILSKVRKDTLLVSVMHANNETGIIQPVEEIGEALKNTDIYFHVDAAQTYGKLVDELQKLKYDMLSISGHKIYGPQGVGALVLRRESYRLPPVKSITFGGGHEGGIRPGTLPVALIAGLGKASEIAKTEYKKWITANKAVKNSVLDQLQNVNHIINGNQAFCLPHTLNVSFPGVDSEYLMLAVNNSCAISNGSACTSHDYKPSHVLTAMGLGSDLIESAIRISWGNGTDIVDLRDLIFAVKNNQ